MRGVQPTWPSSGLKKDTVLPRQSILRLMNQTRATVLCRLEIKLHGCHHLIFIVAAAAIRGATSPLRITSLPASRDRHQLVVCNVPAMMTIPHLPTQRIDPILNRRYLLQSFKGAEHYRARKYKTPVSVPRIAKTKY